MKSIKTQIILFLLLLASCGFDPESFNNIGVKPLNSKLVALPLIEGDLDFSQLLSAQDRSHINRSTIPWTLEYKTWETEAEKDTLTPLLLGKDILENEYFGLQTGVVIPTLNTFQNITINQTVILPLKVENLSFDVNALKVKEGYFDASYINKGNSTSTLSIEVIKFKANDTLTLAEEIHSLKSNQSTEISFQLDDISVTKEEGYTTALRIKNSNSKGISPYSFDLTKRAEIVVDKIGGIHFTPFVDVNIPIPVNSKFLNVGIFDNSLEEGGVTLSNMEVKVVSYNTFGLDILTGEVEVFAQSSIDSSLIPILFQEHKITQPIKVGEERVDTLYFQKPEAVFKKKPNLLILQGDVNLNMEAGSNYFIESDSYIKEQFLLTIPFEVGLNDVKFSTSFRLEENFQESVSFLDSAIFRLEFDNYFPLDASLSIYALDNAEDLTPYLIDLNPEGNKSEVILLKSAILDDNNNVVSPSKVKTSFRLTDIDAQKMIDAELIYLEGTFNTPDGKVVPFTPGQRLFMKAGMAASVKLTPNDL